MADLLPQLHEQALRVSGGTSSVLFGWIPAAGRFRPSPPPASTSTATRGWPTTPAAAAARVWTDGGPTTVDNLPRLLRRLDSAGAVLMPLLSRHEPLGLLIVSVDDTAQGPTSARPSWPPSAIWSRWRSTVPACSARPTCSATSRSWFPTSPAPSRRPFTCTRASRLFCERAAPLFAADSVAIWLHDRRARVLDLVASSDRRELTPPRQIPADDAAVPTSTAMREDAGKVVRDRPSATRRDPRAAPRRAPGSRARSAVRGIQRRFLATRSTCSIGSRKSRASSRPRSRTCCSSRTCCDRAASSRARSTRWPISSSSATQQLM